MNKETNTPVEFIFVPDEFGGAPYSLLLYGFPWTMLETRPTNMVSVKLKGYWANPAPATNTITVEIEPQWLFGL